MDVPNEWLLLIYFSCQMQAYDEYRGLMDDLSKADQFTYQVWEYKNVLWKFV